MSSTPYKPAGSRYWYTKDRVNGRQVLVKLSQSKDLAFELWHTYEQDKDRVRFGVTPKGVLFADALSAFNQKGLDMNKSLSARETDERVFRLLQKHFPAILYVADFTGQVIEQYIHLRRTVGKDNEKALKPSSVNREFGVLMALGSFIVTKYKVPHPGSGIGKVKEDLHDTMVFLHKEEIDKVLAVCPRIWPRAVMVAIYTAMRENEIADLRTSELDFANHLIKVKNRKGRKVLYVPMHPDLEAFLQKEDIKTDYVMAYDDEWRLGRRITLGTMSTMMRKIFKKSGIPKEKRHFHALRHTMASQGVMSGMDLYVISKVFLGHSDLRLMDVYTHLMPNYLQEQVRKLRFR